MMMIAHQKSLTVVFFLVSFFVDLAWSDEERPWFLEVWLGIGLKWISTPALHIAMGSPAEKTFISLTTFARAEFPDGLMEP